MRILQNLIDTTRTNRLEGSLAREVSALKAGLGRAREEGGIDAVLSMVSNSEVQILVRYNCFFTYHRTLLMSAFF